MTAARLFNVYCDESCHLQHDNIPVMAWGAVYCPPTGTAASPVSSSPTLPRPNAPWRRSRAGYWEWRSARYVCDCRDDMGTISACHAS